MKDLMITLSRSQFFWNTLNGAISVGVQQLGGLPYEAIPVFLAMLSYVTKQINKKFNPFYTKK